MKNFDCVNNNIFENFFYLDGISEKLGYKRYTVVEVKNSKITIKESANSESTLAKLGKTILKILAMCTLVSIPIMMIGKVHYRNKHTFTVYKKSPQASKPKQTTSGPQPALVPPAVVPIKQPTSQSPKIEEKITVGTYNILFPQQIVNGKPALFSTNIGYKIDSQGQLVDNSDTRIQIIAQNILKSNLDVICLQELTPAMRDKLLSDQSLRDKYQFSQVKLHTTPVKKPIHPTAHGVAILYKKAKFEEMNLAVLRLDVPNQDAKDPKKVFTKARAHLLLDLKDKTTQKVLRVVSCHMCDPRSLAGDKAEPTRQVIKFAQTTAPKSHYSVNRIIIAGDMNQDQYGDFDPSIDPKDKTEKPATAFQPFIENGYSADENRDSTEYTQKEPGKGDLIPTGRRIDWIFTNFKTTYLPLKGLNLQGSDHVLTAVQFPK